MRFIVLAAMLALLGSAAHAQTPTAVDVATVSMTPAGVSRMVTNTICVTDGDDLVCDRGAYVLPGGLISTTNISATRISGDGSGLTNLPSASASPTNVPAFRVHKSGANQSVSSNVTTLLTWPTEDLDTYNNFNSNRFTPAVPGVYLVQLNLACDQSSGSSLACVAMIYKNGSPISAATARASQYNYSAQASVVVSMNGTTDYVEAYVLNESNPAVIQGISYVTHFQGSLMASGNGLISGSTALGDRITSGTASGVVAMAGGTVSFTTGGTSGTAYLDTVGRFIGPGVSTTGAISATSIYAGASLQLASPTAVTACNSTAAGTIRYNSPTTTLELCTGSGWQPMGVGIPAGTISAFASTTCPTGWSEYTAARGRFLRGIDNGAGNDPSGTRAPGSTQADLLGSHAHDINDYRNGGTLNGSRLIRGNGPDVGTTFTNSTGGAETRPKNVAVTYCQFNGTSNGWNNPLSGGSTVAAGSTGQLQYNTAGAFDASAGLLWDNASSLLTVTGRISATNISVTALTVNGVDITGSGGAASPTNVPAFSVHKNGTAQIVTADTNTLLTWSNESYDTYNNFASNRFTPAVAGKYLVVLNVYCQDSNVQCIPSIFKNGIMIAQTNSYASGIGAVAQTATIVDMNGTTDYLEAYGHNGSGTTINGNPVLTFFQGSLLASGNGLISGSTALGDRITSGTASGVVAMAGGTVSFTTGGTSGTAYLDTVGRFVGAGVSTTGAISATSIYAGASLQLASPTAVTACNSTAAGTIRYNSPTTTLELCTGSGWQPMGVGIPAGTISAFASTTCPTGWSEYTAARGRFLRGIDNGAGNDPDGTRSPGATQADLLASHKHHTAMGFDGSNFYGWLDGGNAPIAGSRVVTGATRLRAAAVLEANDNVRLALTEVSEAPVSGETRPKNVAVTYCQFNGTSNGWNNPLSGGGGGTAAGSTGQIQYNTAGAFDASAGLLWDNTSSLLTVSGRISATNISVTALTVNGVAITGGGGASRLASLTDVTTTGAVSGSVLAFNAATSSWTALPIQQVMSTTTMVSGWPDAIRCTLGGSNNAMIFYLTFSPYDDDGRYYYRATEATVQTGSLVVTQIGYSSDKSFFSFYSTDTNSNSTSAGDCDNKSIPTLYAEGKAFNFIGSANTSASTALGDRITSGTASGVVTMAGGTVSFTTGGVAGTAYLDTVGRFIGPGVSATGTVSSSKVATNDVKLSQVGGQCSTTDDYGRFFRNPTTGRFQLCMPRP